MQSRAIAGKFSVVLSLGLIALVVFAFLGKSRPQPRDLPATGDTTAISALAKPRVLATMPVVLPPPPAPASRQGPKVPTTPEQQAPRFAKAAQNTVSTGRARPKDPSASQPSATANAGAPHPPRPKSKSAAGSKSPQQIAPDKPDRPIFSPRPNSAAKAVAIDEPSKSIVASRSDVAEGRTLLRLLEHGSGPIIELAWPDAARHRKTLFDLLGRCFGMQVALIDARGRLYVAKGQPNAPWNLNLDRFSGFIREPSGDLSAGERLAAERIRAHHRGLNSASLVRVFPRTVDAHLLGGLRRLLGESYATAKAIRARYRLSGQRLVVEQITADGRMIEGRLELPPIARGTCRRSAETWPLVRAG